MASLFLNAANTVLGTANCVVYTAPAAANAVVFSMYLTNTGGNDTTANLVFYDVSATKYYNILYNLPIEAQNAWFNDKPFELMPGDQIYVRSANTDVVMGILELS